MMESYNANDYMVAWTPSEMAPVPECKLPAIRVGPWPDETRWSNTYDLTSGCCFADYHDWDEQKQAQALVNLAMTIAADGVPVADILSEFQKIRVWRHMGLLLPDGFHEHAFLLTDTVTFNPHN